MTNHLNPQHGREAGNLGLIDEARVTRDTARQQELAVHPSGLVHKALLENPNLDNSVRQELIAMSTGVENPNDPTITTQQDSTHADVEETLL